MSRHSTVGIVFACTFLCSVAQGTCPVYETDKELAQYPVIVVAQWDKAERRPCRPPGAAGSGESEVETELNVVRVIKGRLRPGMHTIRMGWGIGWRDDGTGLATYTSTFLSGDVDDVTKPNLWFLYREIGWDTGRQRAAWAAIGVSAILALVALVQAVRAMCKHRRKLAIVAAAVVVPMCVAAYVASEHVWSPLWVPHYRAIQPLNLEEYFAAVASPRPEVYVDGLLKSNDPLVLLRTLGCVCGWEWPWPQEPREHERGFWTPEERGRVLKDRAPMVKELVPRAPKAMRPLVVSVYAELAGPDGTDYLRSLLGDQDPDVRGVAVGLLARQRDEASIPRMAEALDGLKDLHLACAVIEAVAAWGDARLAPVLIPFLEEGRCCYQIGDDLGIPAVKAREGLHALTGHWFPFDVAASKEAWTRVAGDRESAERRAALDRMLPGVQFPLVAELVGQPRPRSEDAPANGGAVGDARFLATVRITNVSGRSMSLARYPDHVFQEWHDDRGGGIGGCEVIRATSNRTTDPYVTLAPGERTEFDITLKSVFLETDPSCRRVSLVYEANEGAMRPRPPTWFGMLLYGSLKEES